MSISKKLHEGYAKFFEEPTREHLRDLLQLNVGEIDPLDFKEEWPSKGKLAKHILAFSNSGGGVLVIGVADDNGLLTSKGLSELKDKSDIEKSVSHYLPNSLNYEVHDFNYTASEYPEIIGKSFQVMIVEHDSKRIPNLSKKEGDGIKDNVIYIRRGTSSTEANHEEIQNLINDRIDSGHSTRNILELEEHLEQLSTLYSSIKESKGLRLKVDLESQAMKALKSIYSSDPNPDFPKESYDKFVSRMIEMKKKKIENILEVN